MKDDTKPIADPDGRPSRQAKVTIDSDLFTIGEESVVGKNLKAFFQESFATPIRIAPSGVDSFGLDMYVTRRFQYRTPAEAANEPESKPVDLLYEKMLHNSFWVDEANNIPIQFILGVVGSGKSTLLRYYLHVHCPKYCQKPEDYKRKLIVYVNLRNTRTVDDLKKNVYHLLRLRLLDACKEREFDLLTADNFAMWHQVMGLESPAYASWGIEDKQKWVAEKMRQIDDEQFVKLVLTYISTKIGKKADPGFPFSYLVLALDNIDQSPYPVMERAMEIVHEWIEMGLKIWKIYVPMWPATFYQLRHNYSRFPNAYHVLRIGPVDEDELFKLRSEKAQGMIRSADRKLVVRDDVHNCDLTLEADELSCYAYFGHKDAPRSFLRLIQSLSGDSTHRELLLWMEVLVSQTLERHYLRERHRRLINSETVFLANTRTSPFEFITNYAWSDALCAGTSRYHHRLSSPIPNIFYSVNEVRDCFDVLVGPHILYVMNRKGARRLDTLISYLCPFGHKENNIKEALEYLRRKHLFEWFFSERMDFDLYPDMGESYCNLITNPAYLDNVAVTTPVEQKRLIGMNLTRSDDPAHFVARVRTTIQFLEQIRSDEDEFCTWRPERGGSGFEEFRTKFDAAKFPSVFDRMAGAYKWRLQYLLKENYLSNEVSASEWDGLFGSPVFADIPDLPETKGHSPLRWRYLLAKRAT